MATCRTCGEQIEVPEGWAVGPAVRRHYWAAHADRMQRTRADRAAEAALAAGVSPAPPAGRRGRRGSTPPPQP